MVAKGVERRQDVKEAEFPLRATVFPGLAGEDVTVRITHRHGDKLPTELDKSTQTIDPAKPMPIDRKLWAGAGVQPDRNHRRQQRAAKGQEEEETDRLTFSVVLIQKAAPPLLTLKHVPPDGADEVVLEEGKPVVVPTGKVRIVGEIKGSENLKRAEWLRDNAERATPLKTFAADKNKTFEIHEDLTLDKPGSYTFRFLASTATSDDAQQSVTVVYQPLVPHPFVTARDGLTIDGADAKGTVPLEAGFIPGDDNYPFKVEVLVNGQVVDAAATVDAKARTIKSAIPLQPGSNRIQLRLSNDQKAVFTTEAVTVNYLRPPKVEKLVEVAGGKGATRDLTAHVRSSLPLRARLLLWRSTARSGPSKWICPRRRRREFGKSASRE